MHVPKRRPITAIVAIVTIWTLVLAMSIPLEAQSNPQISQPNSAAKVSPYVQKWATNTFASTYNQLKARTATGETLRNAATAAQVLFGQYSEVGLTKELENQILQNQETILSFVPSSQQIQSMQYGLAQYGVALTYDQVQSLLNIPTERRKAAISYLQQHGLAYVQQQIVQMLNNQSYAFQNQLSGKFQGASARLRLVQDDACRGFREIIDTVELVAALNGLGCLAGCIPCCGIAVGAGIVAGVLVLGYDVVC